MTKFTECVIELCGFFLLNFNYYVLICFISIYITVSYRKVLQEFGNMPDAKSDMERVGLFKEMGYISIGDKYRPFVYRRSKYYCTKSHCKKITCWTVLLMLELYMISHGHSSSNLKPDPINPHIYFLKRTI